MQLCDLSAVEIRDHILTKQASAVEVLESCLQRIKRVDGRPGELESGLETKEDTERVHAFITLTKDAARAQAEMVDKMIADGEDPGPLAGVPATIRMFLRQGYSLNGRFTHSGKFYFSVYSNTCGTDAVCRRCSAR